MSYDIKLFKGKTLSNVLEEIYRNRKNRDRQITGLISKLEPLLGNINDAIAIVPLIKDYLDIALRNDEHLIKLATIVQRIEAKKAATDASTGLEGLFSEEELAEIESELSDLKIEQSEMDDIEDIASKYNSEE